MTSYSKRSLLPAPPSEFPTEFAASGQTGLGYQRLGPGVTHSIAHRGSDAEEVYVILSGSGKMHLDGESVDLSPLDALRVAPSERRTFAAGPGGLELLAFGTAHNPTLLDLLPTPTGGEQIEAA